MQHHEREYFITRVRSGIYSFKVDNVPLKVYGPTIEEELEIQESYMRAYEEALDGGIKTQEEMLEWMIEREIWTEKDDEVISGLEKDLEKLKVEAYNARSNSSMLSKIKLYLRAGEAQLAEKFAQKNRYQENTCEGIASIEKGYSYIKRCTFCGGQLYDFSNVEMSEVLSSLYSLVLSDSQCRELARNEPWRSLWFLSSSNTYNLFNKNNREPTIDQKNLLIWSKMYDNIQESPECPPDDVIDDDDMLDGWFILQKKKRDKERAENDFESSTKNEKIKNAGEVFVMTSRKDAARVESMNDPTAAAIKKQRLEKAKKEGEVSHLDMPDQKIKMSNVAREMYKDKFRR